MVTGEFGSTPVIDASYDAHVPALPNRRESVLPVVSRLTAAAVPDRDDLFFPLDEFETRRVRLRAVGSLAASGGLTTGGEGGLMPARWVIRLSGPEPRDVNLAHLHAVVSTWLDATDEEHSYGVKPYSVSAPRSEGDLLAVEIGTLTDDAESRLLSQLRPGSGVRFGRHRAVVVAAPEPVSGSPWSHLAALIDARAWVVRFATPTSFRQGRRTSPWPAPPALIRGLALKWERWSGIPLPALAPHDVEQVWVTDVDGASHVLRIGPSVFSGFVGRVRYQCDDARVAAEVGPLFALAPFAGVGSATTKGLGTVRLERTWQPAPAGA